MTAASVLMIELNEADRHFLDRFVASGKLPSFRRMLEEGIRLSTRVRGWEPSGDRAWRHISPWIVWPTIYTGLPPHEHGLVAFGQDTARIRGRCVWEVLDAAGLDVGVVGSLLSAPPRSAGHTAFYVPESLADDAATIPAELEPFQALNVLAARNYNESFVRMAPKALSLLARSLPLGVAKRTAVRLLAQTPREWVGGTRHKPERAFLHSRLQMDVFRALYARHRPRFATVHLNHVAYMQHRYWRAAEPDRFSPALSPTDARYFRSIGQRDAYEAIMAHRIEDSFRFSDAFLGTVMAAADPRTIVLVVTGLGQRPLDPNHEIHNPVVRLVDVDALLVALGLSGFRVRHQMNPDLTIDFDSDEQAVTGARKLGGLFLAEGTALLDVTRRGRQVFVELVLPRSDEDVIRHRDDPAFARSRLHHIRADQAPDQSTAHHHDGGLVLAWSPAVALEPSADSIDVSDVAPTILHLFGLPNAPWMHGAPALEVA
jgi:hypothetical protein